MLGFVLLLQNMETLAYLHLALAHEAPEDTDYTDTNSTWKTLHLFAKLDRQKLSTKAAVYLLSLTLALSLLGIANQASALVREGDRGSEVTALQQRLQQLGYLQGNISGYFGPLTKAAVIRFQQAKGLTADGIVGTNTEASLRELSKSSSQPSSQSSKGIVKLGYRGSQVSAIQESLAVAGFSSSVNGIFDNVTQQAVRQFQLSRGLTADGIVGPQTLAALPAIGGPTPSLVPSKNTTSRFETEALQRRLQARGFYRGAIDGIWGPQTQAAVEAAQRAYSVSTADIESGHF